MGHVTVTTARDADRPTDGRARRRLGVRRGGRRGRGRWDRFVPSFGGGSAVDRASRRREGWGIDVIIIIIIIIITVSYTHLTLPTNTTV